MTRGSKGEKKLTESHRRRMPWFVAREAVPNVVLDAKDKTILDGRQLREIDDIDRMSQADPLEVLKSAVATYRYNTSTGKNLFQLAAELPGDGRGQQFYRREWMEGTYQKWVTLSAIEYLREGNSGTAYGFVTFHGESMLYPVAIDHASSPGWFVRNYDPKKTVAAHAAVPPPPSIGTDVPVDPATFRLKAYPFYDAPNPSEFVDRLLKDRGVLPDVPMDAAAAEVPSEESGSSSFSDGSQHHRPPSSN